MSSSVLFVFVYLIVVASGQNILCIKEDGKEFLDGECFKVYSTSVGTIYFNATDSVVRFSSLDITFNDVNVTITNSRNLTIGSSMQKTRIKCRGNSGIYLKNVSKVFIEHIEMIECGQEFHLDNDYLVIAAILVENSFDVELENVYFINTTGSGLIMLNIGGNSALNRCSFKNSTSANVKSNQSFIQTGALHIQIATSCEQKGILKILVQCIDLTTIHNSTLFISECDFRDNDDFHENRDIHEQRGAEEMRGAGLLLNIYGNSSGNVIQVVNCTFFNNTAFRGGGAYIRLHHRISDNFIHFRNTSFISNLSPSAAGGVMIGYSFDEKKPPSNNEVVFSNCNFYGNKARYSGGVGIYSSSSQDKSITENSIQFRDCVWINNSVSLIGAALGASPVYNNKEYSNYNVISNKLWFVKLLLKDAKISSNFFSNDDTPSGLRSGIVYATIPFWFEGKVQFSSNIGTALDVVSTTANFKTGSEVEFINNIASHDGSALNLIGLSAITVMNNSSFTFRNNTACAGAAIQHHSISPHDYVYSSLCFIRYAGDDSQLSVEKRNIDFVFDNNIATCEGFGNSIHAGTLYSCHDDFSNGSICKPKFTKNSCFNCLANFTFIDENRTEVTTGPMKILSLPNQTLPFPGQKFSLSILLKDELNNTVPGIYHVTEASGDIKLDIAYHYITDPEIRLSGIPGSKGTLNIAARSFLRNNVEADIEIVLQQCPPGYVLDAKKNVCQCSTFASASQQYHCIDECNESSNMAIIIQNWWIDFADGNSAANYDENKLLYGFCPKDHCFNNETRHLQIMQSKPNKSQINDSKICHHTRTGRLCSQCREPYTAHYHSHSFLCGTKTTCKWGWFLYLASEILPVTFLFIIIALFDIKLTSGVVSGFIYFAQTIDKVLLDDTNNYFGSSTFKVLIDLYSLIIRMFNLKFFQLDSTSYCLLARASTLDMIAFHYTTALYSLLLVVLIIVVAHYCSGRLFVGTLKKIRKSRLSARSTLLHGVSGFLVLSYSGITSTSVNLLLSVTLYSIGHKTNSTAVYYSGDMKSLSIDHLPYAIPAILILSTIGLLPPLLLVVYPLCYRFLALMKLNESKFSQILCTFIPLEKMKPLFDSFQSSFKDEYRFFSGLYFIFRLSTLAIQAVIPASGSTSKFYAAISIQSASIFGAQALCQPYKKKWHNILEAIFFFDLTAIAISFTTVNMHTQATSSSIIVFQLILLYLPLLIMVIYTGSALWNLNKACFRCTKRKERENCEYHEFNDSIIFQASENRDD